MSYLATVCCYLVYLESGATKAGCISSKTDTSVLTHTIPGQHLIHLLWLPVKFHIHYKFLWLICGSLHALTAQYPYDLLYLTIHHKTLSLLTLACSPFLTPDCKPMEMELLVLQPQPCGILSLLIFKVPCSWTSLKRSSPNTTYSPKLAI